LPWLLSKTSIEDKPAGVEVALVRQFANSLGANIDWIWGSQEEHLEALKHHELDLAIG
jgi:membrane-bound lytic murein transglycosylase MltF